MSMAVGLAGTEAREERARFFVIGVDVARADEGYSVLVRQLASRLSGLGLTRLISIGGSPAPDVVRVAAARPLISLGLARELRRHRPRLVFYAWPATVAALARGRLLGWLSGGRVVLLAPQPVYRRPWSAPFAKLLWPALVLVQSEAECTEARRLGPAARFLTGVEVDRFRPARPGEKLELRRRWGLTEDARIVLHVGHMVPSRNLGVLAALARREGVQPVFLASRLRSPGSSEVEELLVRNGVVVLKDYRPHVEELYRLADCYVFPVTSPLGAIGMPLSVLEALASDLPVVSRRFGILPELFEGSPGVRFADSDEELLLGVRELLRGAPSTRELALRYSWDSVLAPILHLAGAG
jgi:glycosyltransferase involved in cell wall biosynthesis